MKNRILLMEDEIDIQNLVKAFLEDAGYSVTCAGDGVQGLAEFHQKEFDLILLDVMMPKIDGYAACEMIRKEADVPIIMLTALDDEESQMQGFDLLADDYITKPFSVHLLLRRVEAVLRRFYTKRVEPDTDTIQYKDLLINTENYEVYVGKEKINLTIREFEILKLLLENQGHVFSRERLLDEVWNYDYVGDARIVNTHIKNIRKKIGEEYIETVRGVGYQIAKED